ncbi:hypothetical protein HPB50_008793 [Hyalomma asiaticum]|uniref:Uncharacterized protein n=1 Tax=Hyalomma asiaticum TaxID=266040 RepID=A0ACB7TEW7_HYAAI|nr:hypothetical protein HPB50_008793 [Hyalomma asiaticum]
MTSAVRLQEVRGNVRASVSRNIMLQKPDADARTVHERVSFLKIKEAEIRHPDMDIRNIIEKEAVDDGTRECCRISVLLCSCTRLLMLSLPFQGVKSFSTVNLV